MKGTEAGMCTVCLRKGNLMGEAGTLLPLSCAPGGQGIYVCHSPYSPAISPSDLLRQAVYFTNRGSIFLLFISIA